MNAKIRTLSAAALTGLIVTPALAGQFNQPSSDWNANWAFRGPAQQQVDLNRADLIERKEGGFYEQWHQHHSHNHKHTSHHYGDTFADDTYVGTQVNNTAIGQNYQNNCEGYKAHCSNKGKNTDDVTANQKFKDSDIEGDADNNGDQQNVVVQGDVNQGGGYGY